MKRDERELLQRVLGGDSPRHAGRELSIHPNRVYRLCEKWATKRFYDYGVVADLGWVTDREEAQRRLDHDRVSRKEKRLAF